MTSMRMRLVSSVFFVASYVCRISHRFLRCFCRISTFCTCQLRLAFVFQLCAGVGGGVMTSMRMRLVSSVSFVALLLKRCRLLCKALVAASCCFTVEMSTMQKPRVFEAFQIFQTKTSQLTPKNIKTTRRKAWYLRQCRKNVSKKQDKNYTPKTIETSCCSAKTTQIPMFSSF